MFTTDKVKGTRNYIKTQKKYEVLRTLLYFAIPVSLYVVGFIQTGGRENYLTLVAVLGCLPAAKSAVSAFMFLRYHSCSDKVSDRVWKASEELGFLYDCVFTSLKKNYVVSHIAVRANTVCGFSEDKNFPEKEFYEHITHFLEMDRHYDVTVKIYTDLDKYVVRLRQMRWLPEDVHKTASVMLTLMNVSL